MAHRVELVAAIEREVLRDDASTWASAFGKAGVPAGVVGDIGSAISMAQDLGLEPATTMEDGGRQVSHPITYSAIEVRTPNPPPGLGEHND